MMDRRGCALTEVSGLRAEANHTGNSSATGRLAGEPDIASTGAPQRALEQLYAGIREIVKRAPQAGTWLRGTSRRPSSAHWQSPGTSLRSAVAPDDAFPVQWIGQQAVVTLPEHFDHSSTYQVRDQLLSIINRGATVLIADLTGTVSCDYSGAYALARAQQRASARGTELRLVATDDVARRVVFILNGLGRPIAVYPALAGAIAAGAESRTRHGAEETQAARSAPRRCLA